MADLGNLWFTLGLDNRKFEQEWKATLEKYGKEAKIQIETNLKAVQSANKADSPYMSQKKSDKLHELAKREAIKTTKLEESLQAKVAEQVTKTAIQQERLNQLKRKGVEALSSTNKHLSKHSSLLSGVNRLAGTYFSIFAAGALLRNIVRITGEFEMQKTTLRAILKDIPAADALYAKTQNLALNSPFQFKELITYAKQLSAYSIPKNELFDTMKMLTDVSAGLGVGMDRLTLAYGQIKAASFLRGQEVRQLTEAGIPVLEELAKQFSEIEGRAVSAGQVFDKISARLVPFEMVQKIFKDLTSEGGKFYNMQEIQSETLKGKISNLTDAFQKMYSEIGTKGDKVFKGGVDAVRNLIENYEQVGKEIIALVASYGVYRATLSILRTGVLKLTAAEALQYVKLVALEKAQKALNIAMAKSPYMLLAAGIAAAGYAIYKYATYVSDAEKIQNTFNKATDEYNKVIATETTDLDRLYAKLKLAKEGTKEYDSAKKAIQSKYGTYLDQLEKERGKVIDIADAYTLLKDRMAEANKSRFLESASADAQQEYGKVVDDRYDFFRNYIKELGYRRKKDLSIIETETLWQYINGESYDLFKEKEQNKIIDYANSFKGFNVQKGQWGMEYTNLETLKNDVQEAANAYKGAMSDIEKAFTSNIKEVDADSYIPQGTEKRIQELFAKQGITKENKGKAGAYWYDQFTERFEYIDNIRKRYAEIPQLIKDAGDAEKDLVPALEKEKSLIENIAAVLKISLKEKGNEENGNTDTRELRALKSKEQQLKALKEFKDDLTKYGLSDDMFASYAKLAFPKLDTDLISNIDYVQQLLDLAKEYQKLGKEESAESIFTYLGKQARDEIKKTLEYTEQLKDVMNDLLGQDFNIQGKGIAFDLSKIALELENTYTKIDEEEQNAIELLGKSKLAESEKAYNAELVLIKSIYEKKRSYEKSLSNEKVRDLSNKYVSEIPGLNLTDFGDKTLGQVQTQINRLITAKNNINFGDDVTEQASQAGLALDDLKIKITEILNLKIEDTEKEKFKKIRESVQEVTSSLSKLSSQFVEFGEVMGNMSIKEFGESMGFASDMTNMVISTKGLLEGEATATDKIALSFNIISTVLQKVIGLIKKQIEHQRLLNEATHEYRNITNELALTDYETVFGVNELERAVKNVNILKSATIDYNKALNTFENTKKSIVGNGVISFKKSTTADWLQGEFDKNGLGWSLYKQNGELNIEAVKIYFDKFANNIPTKQKKMIQELIRSWDEYKGAMDEQTEYLKGIFGNLSDSIAESMVDSFIKTGDAATDMGDIVSSVVRELAVELVKSLAVMDKIPEYVNRAKEVMKRMDKGEITLDQGQVEMAKLVDELVNEVNAESPFINAILGPLEKYFKDDESTNSIISGVTEETGSLWSSYINAIRADVSYNRISISEINVEVKNINENMGNGIELLSSIKENTRESASGVTAIKEFLQMAKGEGGSIKVDLINT